MKSKLLFIVLMIIISTQLKASSILDSLKSLTGSSVLKYGKLEVGVAANQLKSTFGINPYDSSDVAMYALFISPTGKRYRRDAFWMTSYSRCPACPNDVVLEPGEPGYCDRGFRDISENLDPSDPNAYLKEISSPYPWSVRFAPPEREI